MLAINSGPFVQSQFPRIVALGGYPFQCSLHTFRRQVAVHFDDQHFTIEVVHYVKVSSNYAVTSDCRMRKTKNNAPAIPAYAWPNAGASLLLSG
jgi:hypothetical protein